MLAASAMWLLVLRQPPGSLFRVVCDDEVSTGTFDRGQTLKGRPTLVEPTVADGRLKHGILAAYLICGQREIVLIAHLADDIEIGAGRLHHKEIGAFVYVKCDFAQRLTAVG